MKHSANGFKRLRPSKLPILAIALLLCGSCSTEPELTPETQSGANKISFRLNGNVSVAEDIPFAVQAGVTIRLDPDQWSFWIYAPGGLSKSVGLEIHSHGSRDTGLYRLGLDPLGHGIVSSATYFSDGDHRYGTTDDLPAWVHVTKLDTINNIVSGTFAMDMAGTWTPDTIHITDGRFDWRFKR